MELSLLLVFWYGVLHAFGPDHLTAIADFSIGKNKQKTFMITALFAIGHGVSLFIFAKVLQSISISEEILSYGDVISATVIIAMGLYLFYMVYANRIQLRTHEHEGKQHIHIWFGKSHEHEGDAVAKSSSLTLGLLMGAGGVRGMLITLGVVQGAQVDFMMVGAFTLGVMLIFGLFGIVMLYINQNFLGNLTNVRRAFTAAGIISLVVGTNILVG
ncbi:MAG: Nickel and cobalt efflux transporter rcnA [uncultured Sulfurovum sp.]|uniref:Nickel and cobalt efflux transporter rcnA n=1 Tax=uncultured Sulfurovum sp. TaxID=269237 RepID=A0A6S6SJV8_9BACT|nr:MAG: Nickel and cobalt efflux transporter rcnA [uncultured Sulfurovum sp.]